VFFLDFRIFPNDLTQMKTSPLSNGLPAIGLIGVTGYGNVHFEGIRHLVESGQARWGGVTVVNPDEAADKVAYFRAQGVPVFGDYREMLSKVGDALSWVSLPTGIGWHCSMAVDCLQRHLHVYIEKPLAATIHETSTIQRAEKESGCRVAVGFQHVYRPSFQQIKRDLLAGKIGAIQEIHAVGLWPRPQSYYKRNRWAGRIRQGDHFILDSPLNNALAHVPNLMLYFAGRSQKTSARLNTVEAEIYRAKTIENYDTVWSRGQTVENIPLSLFFSHACIGKVDPEIHIIGETGSFVVHISGDHLLVQKGRVEAIPHVENRLAQQALFETLNRYFQGSDEEVCTTENAEACTWWVNAVQDACAIHPIPPLWKAEIQLFEETHEYIREVEYWGLRCYREKASPHTLGAPWSAPAATLDLAGYEGYSKG
jgi:predicted dehydrogenase